MPSVPIASPPRISRMESFVFVVSVRNAEPYIERCLRSLLAQRAGGWGAVVIDDCSTDHTWSIIQTIAGLDERFTLVRQDVRRGQLYNIDCAVTNCCGEPDSVITTVDGDDWLPHDRVIDRVRAFLGFDVLWSTYETWPDGRLGISNYLPPRANVREFTWVTSHLRTFRKHLFDRIDKRDFLDADGQYYTMAGDLAFMFPLLEMAGPRRRHFLDEVLYIYNRETPWSEDKLDRAKQEAAEARIRSRTPYPCLYPFDPNEPAMVRTTGWQPLNTTLARIDEVDSEVVLLAFGTSDPKFGDEVGVYRTVPAASGVRFRVRLEIRDSYPDDRFAGRIEQRVRVDDRLVWSHDIGEGSFAGWNTVDRVVSSTTERLRVEVRLVALGHPEPGWRWGEVSRTAIRGFTVERVDDSHEVQGRSLETTPALEGLTRSTNRIPPSPRAEPFVFVVPVYNAASYIGRCLESVRAQRGSWGAVVLDDCSTDGTWGVIRRVAADDSRFTLIRNSERRFALWNTDHAIAAVCINQDSVIAVIDGDDWLVGNDVVEVFLRLHASYDVVWSSNRLYPGGELGWSSYLPPQADVRRYPWVTSQLRTFKKGLFDRIDKQDFVDVDGRYYSIAGDVAFMMPLLEMAGPARRVFLDEDLYIYNRESALNDDKQSGQRQIEVVERIRAKRPYLSLHPLSDDELAARNQTSWQPYGNVPCEFYADGPDFVFIGVRGANPTKGSFVGVQRIVPAEPATDYIVTVEVRDSYSDRRFGGRLEQQIYLDDQLVWRHDLSGDGFAGWNAVDVRYRATRSSVTVRVQLAAVGVVEPGWNWGELSRTLVRGFQISPVAGLR